MKNKIFFSFATLLLLAIPCKLSAQYNAATINGYIEKYKELAINKMYEHKIPASITLAQGIFESACGTSRLAKEGNNHFGIKCHADWTGDTLLLDDDELQECFRKYPSADESYNDHSLFLVNRSRYRNLFSLDIMDYPGWARGLKAAGYATNPQYADRLINLIETYHIAHWDTVYQERLVNGYFKNYPEVQPELAAKSPQPAQEVKPEEPTRPAAPAKPEKPSKPDKKHNHNARETNNKPALNKPTDNKPQGKQPAPTVPIKEEGSGRKPQPAETVILPTPPPMQEVPDAAESTAPQDEKLPTAISVFVAEPADFPLFSEKYPFTDRPVYVNNKTLFVLAQKGDTYAKIAKDVQDTEKRLKKYNNVGGSAKVRTGQVVYIERKSNTGEKEYYTVKNMETLQYISQVTAVNLQRICQYNKIDEKKTLKKGDIIKLKR